jgi:hypothetical protein
LWRIVRAPYGQLAAGATRWDASQYRRRPRHGPMSSEWL